MYSPFAAVAMAAEALVSPLVCFEEAAKHRNLFDPLRVELRRRKRDTAGACAFFCVKLPPQAPIYLILIVYIATYIRPGLCHRIQRGSKNIRGYT